MSYAAGLRDPAAFISPRLAWNPTQSRDAYKYDFYPARSGTIGWQGAFAPPMPRPDGKPSKAQAEWDAIQGALKGDPLTGAQEDIPDAFAFGVLYRPSFGQPGWVALGETVSDLGYPNTFLNPDLTPERDRVEIGMRVGRGISAVQLWLAAGKPAAYIRAVLEGREDRDAAQMRIQRYGLIAAAASIATIGIGGIFAAASVAGAGATGAVGAPGAIGAAGTLAEVAVPAAAAVPSVISTLIEVATPLAVGAVSRVVSGAFGGAPGDEGAAPSAAPVSAPSSARAGGMDDTVWIACALVLLALIALFFV